MKLQKVKINKIFPNPVNPRIIKDYKFKKLIKSIKEFPDMLRLRPIVVNSEMGILGGNMRYKACLEIGLKEVWIIKTENLTEKQMEQFIIKDNSSFGEWDWDLLANEWDVDELKDWGLDIPKWEDTSFDSDIEDTGEYDYPDDIGEQSHVKMVQLFLNTKTEPKFKEWELNLREHYKSDNLTDTIYRAIEEINKIKNDSNT